MNAAAFLDSDDGSDGESSADGHLLELCVALRCVASDITTLSILH